MNLWSTCIEIELRFEIWINWMKLSLSLSNLFTSLETEIDQDIISYPWFSFFFGIGDIIWFLSGWIIFEYVTMDVRMRFNDMEKRTHSSLKPYEVVHRTHRHLWLESSFLIWTLSYLFCHLPRVSFFTFLVIVDIRVSRGILKERNRWWLSHENEWSLRHLRAHLMCSAILNSRI